MMDEFPNIMYAAMVFDELNTPLDWRNTASKRYTRFHLLFCYGNRVHGVSYAIALYVLMPCWIVKGWDTRIMDSTPRFRLRNVAIYCPRLSEIVSMPESY